MQGFLLCPYLVIWALWDGILVPSGMGIWAHDALLGDLRRLCVLGILTTANEKNALKRIIERVRGIVWKVVCNVLAVDVTP